VQFTWRPTTPGIHELHQVILGTRTAGEDDEQILRINVVAAETSDSTALQPLPQRRILDTRAGGTTTDGAFAEVGVQTPGSVLHLQVAGRGGVPAGATAAVLNLTATDGAGRGFVTAWPCDEPMPLASSVNFRPGVASPNVVFTGLAADGSVCLYTGVSSVHLVADVNGLVSTDHGFDPVVPARLLDTRPGSATIDGANVGQGRVAAGSTYELQVAGRGGVPLGAEVAAVNVTAVDATGPGYVTGWSCDGPRPVASSVNYVADEASPNTVLVPLDADGKLCLYVGSHDTQLVVDVFGSAASPGIVGLAPARLLDTRPGESTVDSQSLGSGPVASGQVVELQVAGRGGVPGDASAVFLNVTATGASGSGYVTVWPCDQPRPFASSVNFAAGGAYPNGALVGLDPSGRVCLAPQGAATHLVVDVEALG
jgi:hypothetical protein